MVLLSERISKLYFKLENHHHHHQKPEALSASLQAFRSDVSNCLQQLCFNLKPGSEILSFSWIRQCFQTIPFINKAFAKLVVDVDHHISQWNSQSLEEYLNYSLSLLDLLNSITSSLSHLGQVRLSLAHAFSLSDNSPTSAVEHIKAIKFNCAVKDFQVQGNNEDEKERPCSDEERIINQALMELQSVGFWMCCVVLAGLSGDDKAQLKMKKLAGTFCNSSGINLDGRVISEAMMGRGIVLKEVKELKDAAACFAASITSERERYPTEELQRRLKEFEQLLDGLEKEVNCLFSEVLAGRNELLDGIRHRN